MPRSKAEAKLAFAVLAGKAKDSGMSEKYAREVTDGLKARGPGAMKELPEHSGKLKGRLMRQGIGVVLALVVGMGVAQAQRGAIVDINPFPPQISPTQLLFYDASANLTYLCEASPNQTGRHAGVWAVTPTGGQLTLTNIVVATNVATATVSGSTIKLQIGNKVTVSGSTTSALNGNYGVATTPTTTTITFATSGVSDGTYATANLTLSTVAPRSDDDTWAIQKLTYSSSNLALLQWAGGTSGNPSFSCDSRTTLIYQ